MERFYDDLTPYYHLIFEDWDASIARQGAILSDLIRARFPETRRIYDVSCGIGTQALALAGEGFELSASDLSAEAVARARREARARGLDIDFSVGDMREADRAEHGPFDLLICCDNSLPHLLSDDEISRALQAFYRALRPGGGLLLTLRDYAREEKAQGVVKPYGLREDDACRYVLLQVWDFETEKAESYDLTMHIIREEKETGRSSLHTMRTRYYAVTVEKVLQLLREAGFAAVEQVDSDFYQPVILATRP